MKDSLLKVVEGDGPLAAVAMHDGHGVRDEVDQRLAISDADRLREEDPHTGEWTVVAPTSVVSLRSRFEVDLNRSREEAVYITPEDSWGLRVWKRAPPKGVVERSLAQYDDVYAEVRRVLSSLERRYGVFVVLDLHSYNHRRTEDGVAADPEGNPELNVGTGTMDRRRWSPIVDRFIDEMRSFDFLGRHLDVRENVKFIGRQLPKWVHESFPESGCALALEFKKFFMDERTGEVYRDHHQAILEALRFTTAGLVEESERLAKRKGARRGSGPDLE